VTGSSSRTDTHAQVATELGQRLRQLRRQAGLTQEGLARAASYTKSYIQQLEAGRTVDRPVNPTLETLAQLAGALGVHPGELLASFNEQGKRTPPAEHVPLDEDEEDEYDSDAGCLAREAIHELLAGGEWHDRRKVVSRAAIAVPPGFGFRFLPNQKLGSNEVAKGCRAAGESFVDEEIQKGRVEEVGGRLRKRAC
jgi:transcriptional regulator with XRE-family HTH domain